MSTYGAKGPGHRAQGPGKGAARLSGAIRSDAETALANAEFPASELTSGSGSESESESILDRRIRMPHSCSSGPWALSPGPLLAPLFLLLAGCADRSGCPSEDLVAFGKSEGERGELASLPHDRCELSETERDRYFAARAEGLAIYCDPQRGFDVGLGGELLDVEACPIDRRAKFQSANKTANFLVEKEARQAELLVEARELEARAEDAYEPETSALRQEAAAKRMDARQEENDLEALRGVAIVEGWMAPPELPSEPMPAPVED